ncbi:MAG: hypothetical protein M1816_001012 [Peltula sp. TS41687]|nr:MAG: hypothetical protein M1816_001012 [Peltula sp. TS41687]
MIMTEILSSIPSELPQHCYPSSASLVKLSILVGTCIPSPLALLSSTLGVLSIISWLFAQLPQIIKNYTLGSASGLSPYFLLVWTLGDSTNFLGALFTRQAVWQIVLAGYYVSVDIVLVWQYAWYLHLQPRRRRRKASRVSGVGRDDPAGDDNLPEDLVGSMIADASPSLEMSESREFFQEHKHERESGALSSPMISSKALSIDTSLPSYEEECSHRSPIDRATRPGAAPPRSISPLFQPKTLVYLSLLCTVASAYPSPSTHSAVLKHSSVPAAKMEIAGQILSWCSTFLYLGSRLPQLYTNYIRRSTSGLSPWLFIAAFFGNLFYSTSILTNPCAWHDYPPYGGGGWAGEDGNNRLEWIGRAVPFWLGASGVLTMDVMIGLQFLMFREEIEREIMQDERGRWHRVRGWMRGWCPRGLSPSRLKRAETESLIPRQMAGESYGSV